MTGFSVDPSTVNSFAINPYALLQKVTDKPRNDVTPTSVVGMASQMMKFGDAGTSTPIAVDRLFIPIYIVDVKDIRDVATDLGVEGTAIVKGSKEHAAIFDVVTIRNNDTPPPNIARSLLPQSFVQECVQSVAAAPSAMSIERPEEVEGLTEMLERTCPPNGFVVGLDQENAAIVPVSVPVEPPPFYKVTQVYTLDPPPMPVAQTNEVDLSDTYITLPME